ncbi:ribosome silencing factor [Chloroflexota bacterium]
MLESADIARKAVDAALEKQAGDILMLDIREASGFADYFVICSAESDRQIQAIFNEIDDVLGKEGINPYHREGNADSGWMLLDYSQVVVHIFTPQQREYYNLENLWGTAATVVRIL